MTTTAPPSPAADAADAGPSPTEAVTAAVTDQVEILGYERSPSDVLRLIVFAAATVILAVITRFAEDAILGLEEDVVALLAFISPTIERVLAGAIQLLAAVAVIGAVALAVATRRLRLLAYLAVAASAAPLVILVHKLVERRPLSRAVNEVADRAGISATAFPDLWGIGFLTAAFVVAGPFVTRRWRRAGVALIAVLALLQLLLSVELPASLFLSIALGATVGAAILLAFGRPDTRPSLAAVTRALRCSGLDLVQLEPAKVDARGSTPYFGRLADGGGVFAKVLGVDQRSADLLFRAYRFVRLKNVGDERPFSSLRRTVEHEALVSLQARDVGVRTPRMRAIAATEGGDALLLAYDLIDGRSMDSVDQAHIDDRLLTALWEQVALLRRHRIAHRDLRRANVFVQDDGTPWVIDFGFAEVAASDALLDADVAQLLAGLTLAVGPDRTVASAIGVLGPEPVVRAIPRLQPNALSGATRSAFKARHGLLGELRDTAAHQAGVEPPPLERLERVNGKTLFMVVVLAAVTYFLLPQFADLPGIIDRIKGAHWEWLAPAVACSVLTYVGATLSLMGSVPDRLRPGPTYAAQLGSSFASKLAPSSVGGMALNVRFLQKAGVDPAVAVAGIGLNSLGGLVMHIVLTLLFIVWAGRSAFGSIKLPKPEFILLGLGAVLLLAAGSLLVPAVRHALRTKLLPLLRRSIKGVGTVVRRPAKLALLLGGSLLVTSSYLACIFFSTRAFDGGLSLAAVGAIYLAGSAVATAAPTPGGLGALEAALIAGLVAAGMSNTIAVPAVFLYRLATFWLPVLPGWICFTWLKRRNYL